MPIPNTDTSFEKEKSDTLNDPTLLQLKQQITESSSGVVKCENIRQTLEYILKCKIGDYAASQPSLEALVSVLISSSEVLSSHF